MLKLSSISYSRYILFFFLCATILSCKKEIVPEEYYPTNSHAEYKKSLEKLNLTKTALGKDWINAANKAVTQAMRIESPFLENVYFNPSTASASGYMLSVKRGQLIEINVDMESDQELRTFLDIFRVNESDRTPFTKVASSERPRTNMIIEANTDADYIIRFQPELLRGGNMKITIQNSPSLSFPVQNGTNRDIGSLFGAPRDGGRRKHHGIDIFAKRHTPIIAPTDGYIRFAGERGLGGTVIWMRDDERRQTLYFAHLQDILVDEGQNVQKGDTIGTVGNTGNARTTPPHLHFGIYQNGPVDPYPFVAKTKTRYKRLLADDEMITKTVRSKYATQLKTEGVTSDAYSIPVDRHQIMEVVGTSAQYYKVSLPDGLMGYLDYKSIETIDKAVDELSPQTSLAMLERPDPDAHNIEFLEENAPVKLLGISQNFQLVQNNTGLIGWIKML